MNNGEIQPVPNQIPQPSKEDDYKKVSATLVKEDQNPIFKFQPKTKVICNYRGYLYPAHIVRTEFRNETPFYIVHYQGFKSKFDEEVSEARILEYNDENIALVKEQKRNPAKMSRSRRAANPEGNAENEDKRRKRRSVSSSSGDESLLTEDIAPSIPIPVSLEEILLKDHTIMLSKKQGATSKEQKSIKKLFQDYLTDRFEHTILEEKDDLKDQKAILYTEALELMENSPEQAEIAAQNNLFRQEVCKGLADCLNRFLYLRFLYPKEIDQYKHVYWLLTKDRRNGASIESLTEEELLNLDGSVDLTPQYLPIHFLRLFVQLPELLYSFEPLTKKDGHEEDIYNFFTDILQYMAEHRDELFGPIINKDVLEDCL